MDDQTRATLVLAAVNLYVSEREIVKTKPGEKPNEMFKSIDDAKWALCLKRVKDAWTGLK